MLNIYKHGLNIKHWGGGTISAPLPPGNIEQLPGSQFHIETMESVSYWNSS